MKNLLPILLVLITNALFAQTDILDAKTNYTDGQTVTITGILLHAEGEINDPVLYIQDATAAIALYDWDVINNLNIQRGDEITITGDLTTYSGLREVENITSYVINSSGNALPAAQVTTPDGVDESMESELVRINGATFATSGTFSGGQNYNYTASGESGSIRVNSGSALVGENIPLSAVDMIAIASEYGGAYQLLPRDINDLIVTANIYLTAPMVLSDIQQTSLDFNWTTNMSGSTHLNYGLTPAMGTEVDLGGSTTNHAISASGLTPGTIYYVEGFSVAGTDTAFSGMQVVATASESSGFMAVYFNREVDNNVSNMTDAIQVTDFPDTLVAYINKANLTLDISVYNCNNVAIVNAINDAYNRGVRVRYTTDEGTMNAAHSGLDAGITVVKGTADGLMHNKYVVVDADDAANSWVLAGSTNWTPNNLYDDWNNLIIIQDQSLARAYELEMDEMWGSTSATADLGNAKFGADKTNNTPHEFMIGGVRVEQYFSPSDGTTNAIANTLNASDESIEFALLSFTRNELGTAISDAHSAGRRARGMIESISDIGTEYDFLLAQGVEVQSHQGITHQIHHKYAIVDANNASMDPTVITGSHNWSTAAETKNDENTLIIHDHEIAQQYLEEFSAAFGSSHTRPISTVNGMHVRCNGGNDGSVSVHTSNGTTPYTYEWSNGETTMGLTGLAAGLYEVTVTDAVDSIDVAMFEVLEPEVLVATAVITDESCGAIDGSIQIDVTGGMPGYMYLWSNGASSDMVNGLSAGTYGVTVVDQNDCMAVLSNSVGGSSLVNITMTASDASACGASDGTTSLSATGGATPYNYAWSNGSTTASLTGLSFGVYVLTLTDLEGCEYIEGEIVAEAGAPSITVTTSEAMCFGEASGEATVSNPGTGYTFNWSNGATTATVTGLMTDVYLVTATNGACNVVGMGMVLDGVAMNLTVTEGDVTCNGQGDGTAAVTAAGGAGGFTYLWETAETTSAIAMLDPGTSCVTVSDANGCMVQTCASITEPMAISVSTALIHVSCAGTNDGEVALTVDGGIMPYGYAWNVAGVANTISTLSGGSYAYSVTDANGCVEMGATTISAPSAVAITVTSQDITCFGFDDGTASAIVDGGVTPYNYEWTDGTTNATTAGLSDGIVYVSVTDANGCLSSTLGLISEPSQVNINEVSVGHETTMAANDGQIVVDGLGGTPPYTFLWDDASVNDTIANLDAGTYSVTLTDANGCEVSTDVTVDPGTSGIGVFAANAVTMFPNPAQVGNVLSLSADEDMTEIKIIDAHGKLVQHVNMLNGRTVQITLNDLATGHYVVQVITKEKVIVDRLIIH